MNKNDIYELAGIKGPDRCKMHVVHLKENDPFVFGTFFYNMLTGQNQAYDNLRILVLNDNNDSELEVRDESANLSNILLTADNVRLSIDEIVDGQRKNRYKAPDVSKIHFDDFEYPSLNYVSLSSEYGITLMMNYYDVERPCVCLRGDIYLIGRKRFTESARSEIINTKNEIIGKMKSGLL